MGSLPRICRNPHNSAQNRTFIRDLLPELYKNGFRYLALEALNEKDSLINIRGYPTVLSGYYIKEPVFGQEIRNGLKLGFKVVPIDYYASESLTDTLLFINKNRNREISQANNILKILKSDSTVKIIVHSGFDHIFKKEHNGFTRMGNYLTQKIPFEILSVDCVEMREGINVSQENPFYRGAISCFFQEIEPFVITKKGIPFCSPNLQEKVDFNVFFPRNLKCNNIPNWLIGNNFRKIRIPYKFKNKFISIYIASEWQNEKTNAIPILNFTDSLKSKYINLPLNPEKYIMCVRKRKKIKIKTLNRMN